MASQVVAKNTRKRIKLHKFEVPDTSAIGKLVADGKLRVVDIPAKDARTTASGKQRSAQPARTQYIPEARAGVLGLYGGSEKAVNLAAALYWEAYVKRMNSKGKVADPDRAINRVAEQFAKLDLTGMPQDVLDAVAAFNARAAAVPVAPKARKAKTPKA